MIKKKKTVNVIEDFAMICKIFEPFISFRGTMVSYILKPKKHQTRSGQTSCSYTGFFCYF